MVANSLLLFLAGFDTTGTALSFLLYLLAINPECQEKAYQEALRVIGEVGWVAQNYMCIIIKNDSMYCGTE